MGRGWKTLRLEKAQIAMNGLSRVILGRTQKEKRRAAEKTALLILENPYLYLNRMLVEIWMEKAVLMTFQMEMRNVLLENGNMDTLVIKWPKIWLSCFCSSVLWKVELSGEIGHLVKVIFKKKVKDIIWFFLTVYSKIQEEQSDLKTKL